MQVTNTPTFTEVVEMLQPAGPEHVYEFNGKWYHEITFGEFGPFDTKELAEQSYLEYNAWRTDQDGWNKVN